MTQVVHAEDAVAALVRVGLSVRCPPTVSTKQIRLVFGLSSLLASTWRTQWNNNLLITLITVLPASSLIMLTLELA